MQKQTKPSGAAAHPAQSRIKPVIIISFAFLFAAIDTAFFMTDRVLDFPGAIFLKIPVIGLSYLKIFFHELGHTVANWSFGQPALPTFDFNHGGGMTYSIGRFWPLQIFVWLIGAGSVGWLWRRGENKLAMVTGVILGLHIVAGVTSFYLAVISVMGHVGEMIVACFCLWRVSVRMVDRASERVLNMLLGYFILADGVAMFAALAFSDMARVVYQGLKGGEILGDIDQVSNLTAIPNNFISFALMTLSFCLLIYWLWRQFAAKTETYRDLY